MFGFGGGFGGGRPRGAWQADYTCYSVAMKQKEHLEKGGKILLPPSALDTISRMEVVFPLMFELTNTATGRRTHAGVQEFVASEGECNIPFWMMQNLLTEEGQIITVKNVSLPLGQYVKLQPQSVDFLDLSNPRAVLEVELRNFSALTKGDTIQIFYGSKTFHINIVETRPGDAISIVEADVQVDFEAPVGYKEPERKPAPVAEPESVQESSGAFRRKSTNHDDSDDSSEDEESSSDKFVPFGGSGQRLNGKGVKTSDKGKAPAGGGAAAARAARAQRRVQDDSSDESSDEKEFVPFSGSGYSLK